MKKFIIITDSTCDIYDDLIKEMDVEVIPMLYQINNQEYYNDPLNITLPIHDFYEQLRHHNMATTSQITPTRYLNIISKHLEQGNDVLVITFSSALSGSYNSLRIAKEELLEEYPNANLYIFDSKCASMGEGLLVYYAANLRKEGKSIDEVYNWLNDNYLHLCHWFTVEDLDHLKRGGRLSGAVAFFGKLLKIKPILHVNDEGRLVPVKKALGRISSLDELFNKMMETGIDLQNQTIFISHGDSIEDANYLKNRCLKEAKVKNVIMNEIGPVIGSHSGPGTIALFFIGNKR